jgi:hypothetical protein
MKLTKANWEELEKLAQAVTDAKAAFNMRVIELLATQEHDEIWERVFKTTGDCIPLPYDFHPQPEWTGGETWKTREPAIVGTFPKFVS